jgi:hypothetical protein
MHNGGKRMGYTELTKEAVPVYESSLFYNFVFDTAYGPVKLIVLSVDQSPQLPAASFARTRQ